jgi:glycerol-3-phosphate O-acyltransferase / dihydroxyacetone phosphate acyltransferase
MSSPVALADESHSTEKVNLGYRILQRFVSFWVNRFFRKVEIHRDSDVEKGPIIIAVNHPNNLIDTLLVGYAIKRKVHYLATAELFRNRILSFFLRSSGIIPVYRKQDDPSHADKNLTTFQECFKILNQGGAIGIYPEGTTHAEPRIKKIKTGAARIALEAEDQFHQGIKLVPVGLNYSIRKSFRSKVIINIGAPLQISEYVARYQKDKTAVVEELTFDLQFAMENQIIHVEKPDLERLVKDVEQVYKAELIQDLAEESGISQKEVDSFRLSKKLVEAIDYFNKKEPERLLAFQQEINSYRNRLKKLRLQDETLQHLSQDKSSYRTFLTRVTLLLLGLPLALWGSINHFFPYHISRVISQKLAKKETDYATVRILCGIILYPIFYAIQIYWTLTYFGWMKAFIYGMTLPIFGAFAYYYWDKFKSFRSSLQLFFVMLTRKQLLTHLKERREKLIAYLDRAKEEYLHAHIQD